MRKFVLFVVVAGAIVSCNIRNEETVEAPQPIKVDSISKINADTIQIVEEGNSNSRIANNAKPLLIARGSEPGWYAEFFADHLRLLIDNGTDSLIIQKDFSGVDNDSYNTSIAENDLTISINDKSCTEEASGEKRERTISIKYKNKTYKGCATVKVN